MRRTVLRAAQDGREPADEDLAAELARLMDSREQLTRTMLGSGAGAPAAGVDEGYPGVTVGWVAGQ
jgi:hypothetical protein